MSEVILLLSLCLGQGQFYIFFLYCECLQSNGPKQYLLMEMWLDTLFCCRTPSHCDNFNVL